MIVELISKYLESNKRLTVPNLGTFIVKEVGRTVLFSNLIKGDDGTLRLLLQAEGLSELEAAGSIDRFVFEVNYRLENTDLCTLDGFGVLRNGVNGTVQFTLDSAARGENLDGNMAAKLAERNAESAAVERKPEPMAESATNVEQPTPAEESEEDQGEEDHIEVMPCNQESAEEEQEQAEAPIMDYRPRRERTSDAHVKGLRYGKGRKIVTGREGVISRKRRSSDLIMKIAIAAAVIATLALAYGLYNDWRNSRYMYEGLYDEPVEEVFDEPASTAEQGVRNPDLDYITPND